MIFIQAEAILLFFASNILNVKAFTHTNHIQGRIRKTAISQSLQNEENTRRVFNEKNSIVSREAEVSYSATIGEGVDLDEELRFYGLAAEDQLKEGVSAECTTVQDAAINIKSAVTTEPAQPTPSPLPHKSNLAKSIERMKKPRAYPLFLLEKLAIFAENAVSSAISSRSSNTNDYYLSSGYQIEKRKKERIVVLGSGWGAAAFLKDIDTEIYDVTVISPRNFFLFTPMLAGACVGTVEFRSITEPIREMNQKIRYLEGTATEIDPSKNTVSCESLVCEGNSCSISDFAVEYDKLIFSVGAQTNTFGIPGVREHCCFLKQVEDARKIRTALVNCFERANLPSITNSQREAILTFAIIGAGPTGVEFASELRDFIEQDGPKYYPHLLKYVRIKVIEASPTILAPFDKSLQAEAVRQLTRGVTTKDPSVLNLLPENFQLTELLLNSGVKEVTENLIHLKCGKTIPYGLAVWAAGNGPLPITLQLIESLGPTSDQAMAQGTARGRVGIDPWLRVLGGEGKIFAFGDCSCMVTGQLPATAQVASQQGEYLARLLSQSYDTNPGMDPDEGIVLPPKIAPDRAKTFPEMISSFAAQSGDFAAPFQFLNLGILAYTGGGSALAQLQLTPEEKGQVKGTGKIGFGLWRSVYLSKQVSWRNRFLVFLDWSKCQLFGRDITRIQ